MTEERKRKAREGALGTRYQMPGPKDQVQGKGCSKMGVHRRKMQPKKKVMERISIKLTTPKQMATKPTAAGRAARKAMAPVSKKRLYPKGGNSNYYGGSGSSRGPHPPQRES